MAKRKKTTTALATRPVVVREKAGPITIRMPAPVAKKSSGRKHRSGGGNSSSMDAELKTAAGGYVLAVIEKSPMAGSIPAAPVIGRKGTIALLAWWWGKTNPTVRMMSRGMLAVAAYELGGGTIQQTTQGVSGYVPGTAAAF